MRAARYSNRVDPALSAYVAIPEPPDHFSRRVVSLEIDMDVTFLASFFNIPPVAIVATTGRFSFHDCARERTRRSGSFFIATRRYFPAQVFCARNVVPQSVTDVPERFR